MLCYLTKGRGSDKRYLCQKLGTMELEWLPTVYEGFRLTTAKSGMVGPDIDGESLRLAVVGSLHLLGHDFMDDIENITIHEVEDDAIIELPNPAH